MSAPRIGQKQKGRAASGRGAADVHEKNKQMEEGGAASACPQYSAGGRVWIKTRRLSQSVEAECVRGVNVPGRKSAN